jgi:teichuronic acid biosynthesis glycosyltransferase TuaG
MNGPLISIIMPAYNAEKYIAEAIRSVLDQTYQRWELIVIDDGSTDATADVIHGFASSDSRVRYIFQHNRKLANARNAGIKQSRGELVAFLDSDDLWIREKLELQVKAFRENVADLVFSDGFIFSDNNVIDENSTFAIEFGGFGGAELFMDLMLSNRIPVLSVLVRRKILDEVGGFDEDPRYWAGCEDYDLWLSIARRGYRFYGLRERLVRYRVRNDSMCRQTAAMLKAELAVLEKHRRSLTEDQRKSKKLRERVACHALELYFLEARSGHLRRALPYFLKAFKVAPLTACRPRRLGAVIKRGALAIVAAKKF